MTSRLGVTIALAAVLAAAPVPARAQSTAAAPPSSKPAAPQTFKVVELIPMTCAQAWAVSGKDYARMYRVLAALATVSLSNRDLRFPDSKEAGLDAGTSITKDCAADPHQLLYAIVDKHVRRIAESAAR
jgi:YmgD protein